MAPTIDITYVDANGDEVTIRTAGLEGDYLEATPNTTLRVDTFTKQRNLTVAAGETYTVEAGTTEYFNNITIEAGGTLVIEGTAVSNTVTNDGTLTVNGELQTTSSAFTAYNRLRDLIDAAGNGTVGVDYQGVPFYQDIVRPQANVDSMVVKIEAVDIPEMRDLWAYVTGGEDATQIIASKEDFALDVTVIAPVSEYADRTTLSNALETSGLQFG